MTYLFSVDIEGVSGVVSIKQTDMESKEYETSRELMTKEVNAAVAGAFDGGAGSVHVTDGHGNMRNLSIEELDERVEIFLGYPRLQSMMEGLSKETTAVGYIGYHGSAHSLGTLAHTYSGRVVDKVHVGDKMAGEFALNSYLAGEYEVPVFFISGDQEAVREAKELYPEIPHVISKYATGRYSARCMHPKAVRDEIKAVVRKAVEEGKGKVIRPEDDVIHAWFTDSGKLDNLELLPSVERTGPKEFVIDTGNYETNYKVFRACTMLATTVSQ